MLHIEERHINEMVAHAFQEDPNECCGILAGKGDRVYHSYRITNTAKSQYRYLMDPQEFLNADRDSEQNGWKMIAFYHSHTHSTAYPSSTDVRMSLQSGWLNIYYILVSLENRNDPEMRVFHIDEDGSITEEKFEII